MVHYIPPIGLLVVFSLLLLLTWLKKQNKNLPPGPPRLPILGNLHQLGALPHRPLSQLSKKYGPVMFLQLGSVPTIVISSAEAARQALKDNDLDCCSRPSLTGPRRISYNHLDMGFAPYGSHWREVRKLCVLQLFSTKKLQEFQHIREEEVASLVNSIAQSSSFDVPVNLTEKSLTLTASIVFKAAFGMTHDGREFSDARLWEVVDEAMIMLGDFPASDFFPYVGSIIDRITGLHTRLEKSFNDLDMFFQHLIDYHLKSNKDPQAQEDIVDVLLRVEREQHKLGGVQFSKDHIKAILMDIFFAGVDTSAITITWAMTAAHNSRMHKAQNNYITRSQIVKYTYLACTFYSTFHLLYNL